MDSIEPLFIHYLLVGERIRNYFVSAEAIGGVKKGK